MICSVHFSPEDFSRLFFEGQKYQQRLKKDEIGVMAIPSIHIVKATEEETNRDIRMKRREVGWAFSPLHEKACSLFIPYLITEIVDSSCGVPFSLT